MLQQLLTFLNSAAGQAAVAVGEGLFERGLTAIEDLIALEKAKAAPAPASNVVPISGPANS
jgi:hypothetical protein